MSQLQFLASLPLNKILCVGHRRNLASASGGLVHLFLQELGFDVSQNRADRTKYSKCKEFISYYNKSKKKKVTCSWSLVSLSAVERYAVLVTS